MREAAIRIARVPAAATRPFRQRHLMQHRTLADLEASDGCYPNAGYFAALHQDEVVATASARPERPDWPTAARHPWRVRAVVTAEKFQRRGLATRLMRAVLAHVSQNGGDLVWCNVRAAAVSFYERLGFHVCGPVWDDPHTGPHTSMRMRLDAGRQAMDDHLVQVTGDPPSAGCSRPSSPGAVPRGC